MTPPRRIVICFLVLLSSIICLTKASAQTCDNTNTPPVNKRGWPQGAQVSVWIDPDIVEPRRSKVIQAFNLWNDANRANHSYVHFEVVNPSPSDGNTLPSSGPTFIVDNEEQIPNVQSPDCPTGGCIVRAQTASPPDTQTGQTSSAHTWLDSRVTDPEAVLEVMTHEIGHPAGFGDCDYCLDDESVMAPTPIGSSLNDYNAKGRVASPTPCDNQGLLNANYPCNRPSNCQNWDPDNCVCLAYDLYDTGSGSGEDCTDWYWVEYVNFGGTWIATGWTAYAGCWGKSGNTF